jgi:C-terminal processing protease CtpA/Prc
VDLRGNSGGGYDEALVKAIQALPRPSAALIDAGCISAGETLARDFARYAGARLFGSTTAGSSSSKQQWAFPSGIATVTFSVRSRWRADSKPIEFNGIDPDEVVEEVPAEMARGQNSAILRAEEYLKKP